MLSNFSTMGIGGKSFPLEQQSKDDEQIVYHGTYDTEGVPHTKSGDRQPVQVSIEVKTTENGLCLDISERFEY